MTPTEQLLREIQSRLEAATPGPWRTERIDWYDGGHWVRVDVKGPRFEASLQEEHKALPDATLIANAPSDLAKLIKIVEVLRDGLIKFENYKTIHIKARSYDEPGNSPGHAHTIPGVWDRDNGSLAGKRCAQCYAWNELEDVLLKADAIAAGKGVSE